MSVPDSLDGTIFYANATIPLWSYNMVQGSLSFLPVSTTMGHPTTFLELVNDGPSRWIAGNTTAPQTPSGFVSQGYGFWPMGENLTVYANLQGGGVDLLGVQKVSSSEYQANFYVDPWSGGISSVKLTEGGSVIESESLLNPSAYASPIPQGLTGLYTISYPATAQDVKAVFTNVWGVSTFVSLSTAAPSVSLIDLIPTTTAVAFGFAFIALQLVTGVMKTRKNRPD